MEVRDVDRAISAAHSAIGHIVDDLLPAFELLLQRRFMRAIDDEGRYGCGELVVDSLKMLLNAVRVQKLKDVRTNIQLTLTGGLAIRLQAIVSDRAFRPLLAVVGVVTQLLRKLEHKSAVVRQLAGVALGGVEGGGDEGVQETVAIGAG